MSSQHLRYDLADLRAYSVGSYVRVIGNLRSFMDSRSILAFRVIPIELGNFDQLTYHFLEVIHVHLSVTKGDLDDTTSTASGRQPGHDQSRPTSGASRGRSAAPVGQFTYCQQAVRISLHAPLASCSLFPLHLLPAHRFWRSSGWLPDKTPTVVQLARLWRIWARSSRPTRFAKPSNSSLPRATFTTQSERSSLGVLSSRDILSCRSGRRIHSTLQIFHPPRTTFTVLDKVND